MPVGRRRLFLPAAFIGLAILLGNASDLPAQQGREPPHVIWNNTLTPEQIKAALSKLAIGGDENDPLQKMLSEQLQKQYPGLPREILDAAIQKAVNDPKFMEKARQFTKEKQVDPGRAPKLNQDDLAKLAKMMPRENDTKKLPPNVKLPDNWKNQPDAEPPVDPKRPVNPMIPDGSPPPGIVKPGTPRPVPPAAPNNPMNPVPMNPGAPPVPKTPEDSLFRPPDEPTDPKSKSLQAFASIWERNIGPLDETPEVKRALFDLVSGTNGLDFDFLDGKGNSIWDLLKNGENGGASFGDFMNDSGGKFKMPDFDFPSIKMGRWFGSSNSGSDSSWNWGRSSSRSRSSSSSSGSAGFGSFGFGGSWFPVIVLGIIVLGIVLWVLIKNVRMPTPEPVLAIDGLGAWPVDPRRINTREDVVRAFEYLSVMICGMSAKTWTHNTIAEALAELAATHGETAIMLARLYELARYAPFDEPLTHDELMEARELVCGLAGVSY